MSLRTAFSFAFLAANASKIVRIVGEERKEKTFSDVMEERARGIAAKVKAKPWNASLETVIKRDIALTVKHIEKQRVLYKDRIAQIGRLEMYFTTKLMQLWPGREKHSEYLWREQDKYKLRQKEKWQDKLLELEHEKGKAAMLLEEKLQPLQDRLLSLLQKDMQLNLTFMENGHRKAREKA